MKPELSIIIASFNTEKLTKGCIESILNNDSGLRYEILVVDNGSKDGSVKMLEEFSSKLSNFTLIRNKQNLGFSVANNQAIKKAKADLLLLLNSDTVVKKDTLREISSFAKETADAGVVGAKLINADGSVQSSCMNFPTITNAIKQYFFGQKNLFDKFAPRENMPVEVDAVVGAAFLITPQARKKVGLFDERYFMYFEDIDYCRRVKRSGLKVYYVPSAEVIHYHGASGKNLAYKNNQWRRLIPSSKVYHGVIGHSVLNLILWLGQKWQKISIRK